MSARGAVHSPNSEPASPTTAMIRAMTPETNLARGHLVQCVIMQARPFLLVGLTGGIATGKSAVAAMFRLLGAIIIDADVLAREVVEPGQPALAEIVREFGPKMMTADGRLDRKALGGIVFADADRRRRLEAITHPRIRKVFERRLHDVAAEQFRGVVMFDAPVMIESGNYKNMDRLVGVGTGDGTEIGRLRARRGGTRQGAVAR